MLMIAKREAVDMLVMVFDLDIAIDCYLGTLKNAVHRPRGLSKKLKVSYRVNSQHEGSVRGCAAPVPQRRAHVARVQRT